MSATNRDAGMSAQIIGKAAGSTVQHKGPTAERYRSALERYVSAVAGPAHETAARSSGQDFPPWTVADVMDRSVVTAYEGALFKDIAAALARNRIEAVPVIDEDRHVLGVVTASDLLARVAGARPTPRGHRVTAPIETSRKDRALIAKDLMTAPAIVTTTHASIADAARLAARSRVRCLPVVNRRKELIGMVTRGDLIKLFLRSDDDVLRDIENNVLRRADLRSHAHVHARVTDGVVTFTGTVDTPAVAAGLVHRAMAVPGVVAVQEQLEHKVSYQVNEDFLR